MEKLKTYLILPRILGLLLSLSLLGSLCGCFGRSALPDYREGAARAELRWESDGVTVCAEAEYGAPSAEGSHRDLILRFSAPDGLAGAVLTRTNGAVSLSLGNLHTDGLLLDSLLCAPDLLFREGVMEFIGNTDLGGLRLRYAEIRPKEDSSQVVGLWLDPQNGTPRQVTMGELTVSVLSFQKIQENTGIERNG